jgi:hypothetical protein
MFRRTVHDNPDHARSYRAVGKVPAITTRRPRAPFRRSAPSGKAKAVARRCQGAPARRAACCDKAPGSQRSALGLSNPPRGHLERPVKARHLARTKLRRPHRLATHISSQVSDSAKAPTAEMCFRRTSGPSRAAAPISRRLRRTRSENRWCVPRATLTSLYFVAGDFVSTLRRIGVEGSIRERGAAATCGPNAVSSRLLLS